MFIPQHPTSSKPVKKWEVARNIWKFSTAGLISLIVITTIWLVFHSNYRDFLISQEKIQTEKDIHPYTDHLSAEIMKSDLQMDMIDSFFTRNTGGSFQKEAFNQNAEQILRENSDIKNIYVNSVHTSQLFYPAAIAELPETGLFDKAEPFLAESIVESGTKPAYTISDPFEDHSGRLWIQNQSPIISDNQILGYFGITLDLTQILTEIELIPTPEIIQISCMDSTGSVFYGNPSIFDSNPVIRSIPMSNNLWQCAAIPIGGWDQAIHHSMTTFNVASILINLLVSLLISVVANYQKLLNRQVNQRTAELMKSEARYRTMIEQSPESLIIADPTGKVIEFSENCCELFGYSHTELLNQNLIDFFYKPNPNTIASYLEMLANGKRIVIEKMLIHSSGRIFPAEIRASQQPDGNYQAIVLDISERVRNQNALKESEEKFARTFESSPDVMAIINTRSGAIIECNKVFTRLSGLNREELIGTPLDHLHFWPFAQTYKELYLGRQFTADYGHFEIPVELSEGTTHSFHVYQQPIEINHTRNLLLVARDMNDYYQAKNALNESESRYRSLFESNQSVMYMVDAETMRIVEANHAALNYYKYPPTQFFQMTAFDLYAMPREEVENQFRESCNPQEGHFDAQQKLADGETHHVDIYTGPITVDGRKRYYSIVHDVERRSQREREQRGITELADALRTSNNRDEMIPFILEKTKTLLLSDFSCINLITGIDESVITYSDDDTNLAARVDYEALKHAILRELTRSVKIIHLNMNRQGQSEYEHFYALIPVAVIREIGNLFIIPLIVEEVLLGWITLGRKRAFSPQDESIMKTISNMSAVAFQRNNLIDALIDSNIELERSYDVTLEGWAKALELRDPETEGHSRRVTAWTVRLARKMDIPESEIIHLRRGAILHDIGKLGVPDAILNKPGPLDDEEWKMMRNHPVYAHEWLSPVEFLRPALNIPYYHHELWNGSGYPRGLRGETIPLEARIFTVIDVWDALLSNRPYRPAWSIEKAVQYIHENAGIQFDPIVVQNFLELLKIEYSISIPSNQEDVMYESH
ncbi:MAG: PAS domain S-box protein [Anaerolineaceae bacterium]|nr:PAS domain S-box protein [Anaerolineaceae bacterium]